MLDPLENPSILKALPGLQQAYDEVAEVIGDALADRDPELLARYVKAWGRPFDPTSARQLALELRKRDACPTCGGCYSVPLWAAKTRERRFASALYDQPDVHVAAPCWACAASLNAEEFASKRPPSGDACEMCIAGLVPQWLSNMVEQLGSSSSQDPHEMHEMHEMHETSGWTPFPCPACGGWGRVHAHENRFIVGERECDFSFRGETKRLAVRRGYQYIAQLLQVPGQSIHALAICANVDKVAAPQTNQMRDGQLLDEGSVRAAADDRAVAEYYKQYGELEREKQRAHDNHDLGKLERIQEAMEFLSKEISQGKLQRVLGEKRTTVERARKRIDNSITRALDAMRSDLAELADHLEGAIEKGNHFCYRADHSVLWTEVKTGS